MEITKREYDFLKAYRKASSEKKAAVLRLFVKGELNNIEETTARIRWLEEENQKLMEVIS